VGATSNFRDRKEESLGEREGGREGGKKKRTMRGGAVTVSGTIYQKMIYCIEKLVNSDFFLK